MKLYWHPFSIFPRRIQIALREKGIPYDQVEIDLPGGAHRGAAFRRLNPFAQVPVLEDGDLVVSESIAILEYLEERYPTPALLPAGATARALARQLMLWSGNHFAHAWESWIAPRVDPTVPADAPSVQQGRDAMAMHLEVLEARLGDRPWLVGDYSLADVCYAPFVTVLEGVGLGDLTRARPAVHAWIARLVARPAVRDTTPSWL